MTAEEANLRYNVEVLAEEEEEERDQEDKHKHQRRIFICTSFPVSTNTLLFGHVHHHGSGQNAVDHIAEAQALAREQLQQPGSQLSSSVGGCVGLRSEEGIERAVDGQIAVLVQEGGMGPHSCRK